MKKIDIENSWYAGKKISDMTREELIEALYESEMRATIQAERHSKDLDDLTR